MLIKKAKIFFKNMPSSKLAKHWQKMLILDHFYWIVAQNVPLLILNWDHIAYCISPGLSDKHYKQWSETYLTGCGSWVLRVSIFEVPMGHVRVVQVFVLYVVRSVSLALWAKNRIRLRGKFRFWLNPIPKCPTQWETAKPFKILPICSKWLKIRNQFFFLQQIKIIVGNILETFYSMLWKEQFS